MYVSGLIKVVLNMRWVKLFVFPVMFKALKTITVA